MVRIGFIFLPTPSIHSRNRVFALFVVPSESWAAIRLTAKVGVAWSVSQYALCLGLPL
jgi:hypothetical protein